MINEIGYKGQFVIKVKNKITGETTEEIINNRIMNAALNKLVEVLEGNAPDLEIKYLAVGTGNTAITDTDTQLATEIFRTEPVVDTTRTATGQAETEFVLLDSEAVAQIEEIGIFCGSTAGAGANTGTLLSRILWSKNKTNSEEISIKRVDRMVRA